MVHNVSDIMSYLLGLPACRDRDYTEVIMKDLDNLKLNEGHGQTVENQIKEEDMEVTTEFQDISGIGVNRRSRSRTKMEVSLRFIDEPRNGNRRSFSAHPRRIKLDNLVVAQQFKDAPGVGIKRRSQTVHPRKDKPRNLDITPELKDTVGVGEQMKSRTVHPRKDKPRDLDITPEVKHTTRVGFKKRSRTVHPRLEKPRELDITPKIKHTTVGVTRSVTFGINQSGSPAEVFNTSRKRSKTVLGFGGSGSSKKRFLGPHMEDVACSRLEEYTEPIEASFCQGQRRSLRLVDLGHGKMDQTRLN